MNLLTCVDSNTSTKAERNGQNLQNKYQNNVTRHMLSVTGHVSHVTYHASHVLCHMSCVMCHVSCVMCQLLYVMSKLLHIICHLSLKPTATAIDTPPYNSPIIYAQYTALQKLKNAKRFKARKKNIEEEKIF